MANDVKHLFICLFSIDINFSVKYLFVTFAWLLVGLVAFLLGFGLFIYFR